MKKFLLLSLCFFTTFTPSYAEIPWDVKNKIDIFVTKYENNKGFLTRVETRLAEFEAGDFSEDIWEIILYFRESIEEKITLLDERDTVEVSYIDRSEVKALYYSAYATSRTSKIDEIISLAKNTEINALVIDIKEIDGKTSFSFEAQDFSTIIPVSNNRISDIKSILKRLKDNDIYTIGRIVVFKDEYLANTRPDLAIKWSWDTNKVWGDYKWNSYTDPGSSEVWDYHIEMASAAYKLWFDEINFDYVRFPSDGYISQTYYPKSNTTLKNNPKWWKMITMDRFAEYINRKLDELHPNLVVSADIFGLVTNVNLFQIGQNLESYTLYFDYIAPMIYPSHYANGYLWNAVADNAPYAIFYDSMKKSKERIEKLNTKIELAQSGTWELLIEWAFVTSRDKMSLEKVDYNKVRPWLQGFHCSWCKGATPYSRTKFREQIRAIEELWFSSGWYVWNASSRYESWWYNK